MLRVSVKDYGHGSVADMGRSSKLICEVLVGESELSLDKRVVRTAKVAEGEMRGWSIRYVGDDGGRRDEFFDGVVLGARLAREWN